MDDYVIGLRRRSVLGYTVDRGIRPESTRWKEVKRRRPHRRAMYAEARGGCFFSLKKDLQHPRLESDRNSTKIFCILHFAN